MDYIIFFIRLRCKRTVAEYLLTNPYPFLKFQRFRGGRKEERNNHQERKTEGENPRILSVTCLQTSLGIPLTCTFDDEGIPQARKPLPHKPRAPLRNPQNAAHPGLVRRASSLSSALHSTCGSWLNLVERWFAELTTKQIRSGAHRSCQ